MLQAITGKHRHTAPSKEANLNLSRMIQPSTTPSFGEILAIQSVCIMKVNKYKKLFQGIKYEAPRL